MARRSASSSAAPVSASTSTSVNGHISAANTTPVKTLATPGRASSPSTDDDTTLKPIQHDDDSDYDSDDEPPVIDITPLPMDESLYPGGSRDLSSIGLQAFVLGNVCSLGALLTWYLVSVESLWWRLPAFFGVLSFFHFLEYWAQARYNTPAIRADSFLIFSNGVHYNVAHGCATIEFILGCIYPSYGQRLVSSHSIALGIAFIAVGQAVRTIAMANAGVSFNHIVARERKESHVLVTSGIYSIFRHPSYFGFFWWAIGTQLLVGNKICLLGFIGVLHHFFRNRIRGEEKKLVEFFGDNYVQYRKRVGTKIPFIR